MTATVTVSHEARYWNVGYKHCLTAAALSLQLGGVTPSVTVYA